jgi:RING/Ubox like zinc-binding domain
MSVLNLSGDEAPECPLCMELLELDDISFYPCACGYQVGIISIRDAPDIRLYKMVISTIRYLALIRFDVSSIRVGTVLKIKMARYLLTYFRTFR